MANEATLIVQRTLPINMTCSNSTGIEKGAFLALTDPNTATLAVASSGLVAGIAYGEKIASDGQTKVAVLRGPGDIVKVYASGSIGVGDPCAIVASTAWPNFVGTVLLTGGTLSGAKRIGFAMEAANDGESFLMELNIGNAN